MSIAKVNDAQIPEDYTRNPEITKVNDTQIHQCTNIDKTYQWKSRKIGETQILGIYTRNPEITKGGRPITNGSIKLTNTCITNGMLIPWSLTITN